MAHVMNYQEICDAAKNDKIIWEEVRTLGLIRPLRFDGVDFVGVKHSCYLLLCECDEDCEDYNVYYRCWDEEPSEELMNSTEWKGAERRYEDQKAWKRIHKRATN